MEQPLPPDVDRLIEQLKSPDPGENIRIIRSLADLDCQDEKIRLALERLAWDNPDVFVRTEARYSLGKLGYRVRPPDGWIPSELAGTILTDAQSPDTSQDTDLMKAETHANTLQTSNVVFLLVGVPLFFMLGILWMGGGSPIPVFVFLAIIALIYYILWHRPVHCQTPGCNGRMEKTQKPVSAFKAELRYRCPICNSVYVCEIFQPQGDDRV